MDVTGLGLNARRDEVFINSGRLERLPPCLADLALNFTSLVLNTTCLFQSFLALAYFLCRNHLWHSQINRVGGLPCNLHHLVNFTSTPMSLAASSNLYEQAGACLFQCFGLFYSFFFSILSIVRCSIIYSTERPSNLSICFLFSFFTWPVFHLFFFVMISW